MGKLALSLRSRATRRRIAPDGRKISVSSPMLVSDGGGGGGGILGLFVRAAGFITRAVSNVAVLVMRGAGAILRGLISAAEFVGNFDWQASDEELKATIRGRNEQIYRIMGGLAGRAVGSVVAISIGVGVSFAVPVIGGRALAASILESTSPEMLEDYWQEVKTGAQSIGEIVLQNTAAKIYMWGRRAIKSLNPGTLIGWLGQEGADFVMKSWGAQDAEPWTLVGYRDKRIEEIKNRGWSQFAEEFVEEGWDALREGVFLISGDLDDAANSHLLAQAEQKPVGIELQPDREQPREVVKVYGSPRDLEQRVHDTMMTRQLLGNRDVGYIGALQEEAVWIPEFQRRRLTLVVYSVKEPPWMETSAEYRRTRATRRQINIPNPRRSLSWSEVKAALGGASGYTSGVFFAKALMSSRRKIGVYGSTAASAQAHLEDLARLSDDTILNVSVSEQRQRGTRPVRAADQRKQMYPAFALTAKLNLVAREEGRMIAEGNSYAEHRERVELWHRDPPDGSSLFT